MRLEQRTAAVLVPHCGKSDPKSFERVESHDHYRTSVFDALGRIGKDGKILTWILTRKLRTGRSTWSSQRVFYKSSESSGALLKKLTMATNLESISKSNPSVRTKPGGVL